MFLLRKRKMILNFGKMLDIMPKFWNCPSWFTLWRKSSAFPPLLWLLPLLVLLLPLLRRRPISTWS